MEEKNELSTQNNNIKKIQEKVKGGVCVECVGGRRGALDRNKNRRCRHGHYFMITR